jgi:hypothetical protein
VGKGIRVPTPLGSQLIHVRGGGIGFPVAADVAADILTLEEHNIEWLGHQELLWKYKYNFKAYPISKTLTNPM